MTHRQRYCRPQAATPAISRGLHLTVALPSRKLAFKPSCFHLTVEVAGSSPAQTAGRLRFVQCAGERGVRGVGTAGPGRGARLVQRCVFRLTSSVQCHRCDVCSTEHDLIWMLQGGSWEDVRLGFATYFKPFPSSFSFTQNGCHNRNQGIVLLYFSRITYIRCRNVTAHCSVRYRHLESMFVANAP